MTIHRRTPRRTELGAAASYFGLVAILVGVAFIAFTVLPALNSWDSSQSLDSAMRMAVTKKIPVTVPSADGSTVSLASADIIDKSLAGLALELDTNSDRRESSACAGLRKHANSASSWVKEPIKSTGVACSLDDVPIEVDGKIATQAAAAGGRRNPFYVIAYFPGHPRTLVLPADVANAAQSVGGTGGSSAPFQANGGTGGQGGGTTGGQGGIGNQGGAGSSEGSASGGTTGTGGLFGSEGSSGPQTNDGFTGAF